MFYHKRINDSEKTIKRLITNYPTQVEQTNAFLSDRETERERFRLGDPFFLPPFSD